MGKGRQLTLLLRLLMEMHPRNLYNKKPDFGELAAVRPTLRPYLIPKSKQLNSDHDLQQSTDHVTAPSSSSHLPTSSALSSAADQEERHQQHHVVAVKTSNSSSAESDLAEQEFSINKFAYTLDFSDPSALRELTCAVLERDFWLKVEIPLDKLIPAVPQRLNYVHWMEDLLMCCEDRERKMGLSGVSKGAESAVGEVGVASDCADSAVSGEPQIQMEVKRMAPSDCTDSTVCGGSEEGVASDRKEGVASDHADVTVPKGDSIIGVDIGTSLIKNYVIITSLWVHPHYLGSYLLRGPSSRLVLYSLLVTFASGLTKHMVVMSYHPGNTITVSVFKVPMVSACHGVVQISAFFVSTALLLY